MKQKKRKDHLAELERLRLMSNIAFERDRGERLELSHINARLDQLTAQQNRIDGSLRALAKSLGPIDEVLKIARSQMLVVEEIRKILVFREAAQRAKRKHKKAKRKAKVIHLDKVRA